LQLLVVRRLPSATREDSVSRRTQGQAGPLAHAERLGLGDRTHLGGDPRAVPRGGWQRRRPRSAPAVSRRDETDRACAVIVSDVPLASKTSLELGGAAKYYVEVNHEADLAEAIEWADARGLAIKVLGGGSNLVVSDAGVDGLVIAIRTRGIEIRP